MNIPVGSHNSPFAPWNAEGIEPSIEYYWVPLINEEGEEFAYTIAGYQMLDGDFDLFDYDRSIESIEHWNDDVNQNPHNNLSAIKIN